MTPVPAPSAFDAKPLEFTQAIIARMAGNSFQMKAWNVALATAVIGFVAGKDGQPGPAAVFALVPALAFWGLDAYYLALEKRFRDLYTIQAQSAAPSYDLKITDVDAALFFETLIRPAVIFLHLPLLITVGFVSRWR